MSLIKTIQAAFTGGEVSPSLYPRVDIDKYRTSARTVKNFIIHPHGGVSNRPGTKKIYAAKNGSDNVIIQEFVFSRTQIYNIELGGGYIRFYTDGAIIQEDGVPYEISSPYLANDLNDLRFESSADVIWITHPRYITRTLTRYGNTDWRLELYEPVDGPFRSENTSDSISLTLSSVSGTNATLTLSADVVYDTTITALLHFDGTNNSTVFTEDTGRIVYVTGTAKISTAQSVFGGSSLYLDGTNSGLTMAPSSAWHLSGDFTISARVYFEVLDGKNMLIWFQGTGDINTRFEWATSSGDIRFFFQDNVGPKSFTLSYTQMPTVATWYEVRVTRSGNNFYLFLDGVLVNSATDSYSIISELTQPLFIGSISAFTTNVPGYIDEWVFYNGTATHTTSYSVPTTPYAYATTVSDFLFSPLHVGALFRLRHFIESQRVSSAFSSATASSGIKCFTTWRVITHGTWTGVLNIEKSSDGGSTWSVIRSFSSANDFNANTSGTEDLETNLVPFLVRSRMVSYTSGTANVDLTTDSFYQDGIVRATTYNSQTSMQVNVLQTAGSTSPTISWFEGAWSGFRGYPSISRFYQDRITFASTPSDPQTLWMSVTGNYYSFRRGFTLLDTDGITINLPSRQLNAVAGLVAFKRLLVTTLSSLWSVFPISGNALTPTSIQTDVEEYTGSDYVDPLVINNEIIFSEYGGEVIRSTGYQLQADAFTGSEVNILARHLFEGYSITRFAYQKKPNGIVWALRSDGKLLAMTYLREQEVVAWAQHDVGGEVVSISVIPVPGGDDELWLAVRRESGVIIESMRGRQQFILSDHVFLDSYVRYTSPTLTLSSLEHLANEVVGVVADDVYLGTMTVSSAGTLALSSSYSDVCVGLLYESDLETLDIDIPLKSGAMQGNSVKVGNVTFRLLNSRGGWVGPTFDGLYEAFNYSALNDANARVRNAALGATEKFSGTIRVPVGAGAQTAGRVCFRQSDPYPVSIGAILPEINIGGSV